LGSEAVLWRAFCSRLSGGGISLQMKKALPLFFSFFSVFAPCLSTFLSLNCPCFVCLITPGVGARAGGGFCVCSGEGKQDAICTIFTIHIFIGFLFLFFCLLFVFFYLPLPPPLYLLLSIGLSISFVGVEWFLVGGKDCCR